MDAERAPASVGIKRYDIQGLRDLLAAWGEPRFRATQLLRWLYARQTDAGLSAGRNDDRAGSMAGGWIEYQEMTDLPASLRERLAVAEPLAAPHVLERRVSVDGSRKFLLRLADGALVETVGIPSKGERRGDSTDAEDPADNETGRMDDKGVSEDEPAGGERLTVCFSTQVGCAMGCSFCATGTRGLTRSLWPGEMVDQLVVVAQDFGRRITNAVAMGEGEPFANYDATLAALRIMNSPHGLEIGARRLTVSSCGLLGPLRRFAREPEQFTLAVSLHSAVQKTRDMLMPALAGQPLDELRSALVFYAETTGRRPSLEFTLIRGVNDTPHEIDALIAFARGMLCHINLIPLNSVDGNSAWSSRKESPSERAPAIIAQLRKAGIECSLRRSRGADIAGACGQLKGEVDSRPSLRFGQE